MGSKLLDNTIALVQEPWVYKSKITGLSSTGDVIHHAFGADRPRTCIVVPKHMSFTLLDDFCKADLTVGDVRIRLGWEANNIRL